MNKPTKKQLEDRIRELEAKLNAPSVSDGMVRADIDSLAAESRRSAAIERFTRETTTNPVYEVRSVLNVTVSAEVTDAFGNPKRVIWPSKGDIQVLTASQIAEVQDKADFFEMGFLTAPEIIPPGPNTIENFDKFIEDLNIESIRDRISAFTYFAPLQALYHYLETKRISERGEIQELAPKQAMVLFAVSERLQSQMGISFSSNGAE